MINVEVIISAGARAFTRLPASLGLAQNVAPFTEHVTMGVRS